LPRCFEKDPVSQLSFQFEMVPPAVIGQRAVVNGGSQSAWVSNSEKLQQGEERRGITKEAADTFQ